MKESAARELARDVLAAMQLDQDVERSAIEKRRSTIEAAVRALLPDTDLWAIQDADPSRDRGLGGDDTLEAEVVAVGDGAVFSMLALTTNDLPNVRVTRCPTDDFPSGGVGEWRHTSHGAEWRVRTWTFRSRTGLQVTMMSEVREGDDQPPRSERVARALAEVLGWRVGEPEL